MICDICRNQVGGGRTLLLFLLRFVLHKLSQRWYVRPRIGDLYLWKRREENEMFDTHTSVVFALRNCVGFEKSMAEREKFNKLSAFSVSLYQLLLL